VPALGVCEDAGWCQQHSQQRLIPEKGRRMNGQKSVQEQGRAEKLLLELEERKNIRAKSIERNGRRLQ
jgi:hypothetical protein